MKARRPISLKNNYIRVHKIVIDHSDNIYRLINMYSGLSSF